MFLAILRCVILLLLKHKLTLSYFIHRSTAVYGGAGVAEQIGDLKRGVHIVSPSLCLSFLDFLFGSHF